MAVTAILVVRIGRIWEDARSILVVLLLCFVAISVSFDEVCNVHPQLAAQLLGLGWILSAAVAEVVLFSLQIRLRIAYRLPLHALILLFFAYPLYCSPLLFSLPADVVTWRIFGFPVAGAGVLLTLLPAIRKGQAYVANNGTPWRWPMFPWTIFVSLFVGLLIRSYALSLSFGAAPNMQSAFGLYFLLPLFFAALILMMEGAIVGRNHACQQVILATAPALLLLTIVPTTGKGAEFNWFLAEVTETIGSPVVLTLSGLIAFYTAAWLRAIPRAQFYMHITLMTTVLLSGNSRVIVISLVVIGMLHLVSAITRHSSLRFMGAAACLILAAGIHFRETTFWVSDGMVPCNLLLGSVLIAGLAFRDRMAVVFRMVAAVGMIVVGVATVSGYFMAALPTLLRMEYVALLAVIGLLNWCSFRKPYWLIVSIANAYTTLFAVSHPKMLEVWNRWGAEACVLLVAGLFCFAIALMITAAKSGLLMNVRHRWSWRALRHLLLEDSLPEP